MIDPIKTNFTVYPGVNWERSFTMKNPDGTIQDLSGCTATFTARQSAADASPPLSAIACTVTVLESNGNLAGRVTVSLTPAQTSLLTNSRYGYFVALTFPDTTVFRVAEGTLQVDQT